jgi:hypothetical protein
MSLAETMARRFSAAKAGGRTVLLQGLGKRRADHGGVGGRSRKSLAEMKDWFGIPLVFDAK